MKDEGNNRQNSSPLGDHIDLTLTARTNDSVHIISGILRDAIKWVSDWCGGHRDDPEISELEWPSRVRDAWIASLRDAFSVVYRGQKEYPRYEVYAGKPDRNAKPPKKADRQVSWNRWEFLYDIAVLEVHTIDAAYHSSKVAVATRALWLVESEIAGDGSQVAEDASKLRIGTAPFKLLIASKTSQHDSDKWLEFLGKLSHGADGAWYLGLITSYAPAKNPSAGTCAWRSRKVDLDLYICNPEGTKPHPLGTFSMPPEMAPALSTTDPQPPFQSERSQPPG